MVAWIRASVGRLLRIKFVRDTITLQVGKLALAVIDVAARLILIRGLGTDNYGVWALVGTMYGLLMFFNITGLGLSTLTRLAESLAAGDRDETRDLMAFFVQVSLLVAAIACAVAFAFGPAFAEVTYGNRYVGELMRLYTLVLFLQPVYQLMLLVLQSHRSMRAYAVLENGGVVVDGVLVVAVVLLGWGAAGVVAAYLLSALVKAVGSLWAYRRLQARWGDRLPTIGEILSAARRNSPRPYWRFGVALALDKNLSSLFTLLPQQLVGMWHGEAAAGFLKLALSGLERPYLIFTGVLTNLAAQVPAEVGQGDFRRLQRNFRRVATWVAPASLAVFGAFALAAPIAVPILVGEEYIPVIPVIQVLCIYGAVTGIGGVFGPLYRALRLMRLILAVKVGALALAALPALALVQSQGVVGGAWAINLVYALSVGMTIAVTWPRVRRLAQAQGTSGQQPPAAGE